VVAAWLLLSPALPSAFAASWDDVGPGVCVGMCTCEDWGTCGDSGNGGNGGGRGWQWIDPAELQHKEELKRQWREYRAKKAARSAAQREFRKSMRNLRKNVRQRWKGKSKGMVFVPKGKPIDPSVGHMLNIVANPNTVGISLAGIELARPVSVQLNGETTHFALEGLRKFSAILEYSRNNQPASGSRDEELHFLLNEAAAHMSGQSSRVSVQLSHSIAGDEDARRAVESFQATWGMIEQSQRDIHRSEENRMNWAREAAREEADIDKLNVHIRKASGKKKERLKKKQENKVERIHTLKKKFYAAIQMENQLATRIKESTEKLKKYPNIKLEP
jgi:hypothetical protein